jgi:hypothetical protein
MPRLSFESMKIGTFEMERVIVSNRKQVIHIGQLRTVLVKFLSELLGWNVLWNNGSLILLLFGYFYLETSFFS